MCLRGRERKKRRERELFHLLVYSSTADNSWGWAELKPGALKTLQVSHVGGGDGHTWAIHCYIPRYSAISYWVRNGAIRIWIKHYDKRCSYPTGILIFGPNSCPAIALWNSHLKVYPFICCRNEILKEMSWLDKDLSTACYLGKEFDINSFCTFWGQSQNFQLYIVFCIIMEHYFKNQ